jgi:hypothetical protein
MNERAPGTGIATSLMVVAMSETGILRAHLEVDLSLAASALTTAMVRGAHLDLQPAAMADRVVATVWFGSLTLGVSRKTRVPTVTLDPLAQVATAIIAMVERQVEVITRHRIMAIAAMDAAEWLRWQGTCRRTCRAS